MSELPPRSASLPDAPDPRPVGESYVVGSKRFTESLILAEIGVAAIDAAGGRARHVQGLGGTAIVFRALEEGSIDAYPEYLGTLTEAILHEPGLSLADARQRLRLRGLDATASMGFENGYALAVNKNGRTAELRTLGDLAHHPELTIGLSNEFMARADGWPRLRERYGLAAFSPQGLDHGLAYAALEAGRIDVLDVYTTDASLARYDLRLLEDTALAFPSYEAIWLHRQARNGRDRAALDALARVRLTREEMVKANDAFERGGLSARQIAAARRGGASSSPSPSPPPQGFWAQTANVVRTEGPRHLTLVSLSLLLACALGVPLGVIAARYRKLGAGVLAVTAVLQTIPALALLCFFVPIFGIGQKPTIVALFVYGLLPIVRNTTLGFRSISPSLRDASLVLGLPAIVRFRTVELPLALPSILAGIRTAAVLAVGTATIAAFVGAGGFGQPISAGLSVNDPRLILQGALPAAALALLVELAFAALERALVPAALRGAETAPDRSAGGNGGDIV